MIPSQSAKELWQVRCHFPFWLYNLLAFIFNNFLPAFSSFVLIVAIKAKWKVTYDIPPHPSIFLSPVPFLSFYLCLAFLFILTFPVGDICAPPLSGIYILLLHCLSIFVTIWLYIDYYIFLYIFPFKQWKTVCPPASPKYIFLRRDILLKPGLWPP